MDALGAGCCATSMEWDGFLDHCYSRSRYVGCNLCVNGEKATELNTAAKMCRHRKDPDTIVAPLSESLRALRHIETFAVATLAG
jgi:hypothetical protein